MQTLAPTQPATCDRCRWLTVSVDEARCGWANGALIASAWKPGDARPSWCPKQQEPAS